VRGNGMPERLIDVPLESLPNIDEHSTLVAAPTEVVWDSLLTVVGSTSSGWMGSRVARALGCTHTARAGKPGRIGSTVPGFVVTRSVRPAVLALMGEHRFSRYALIFQITETPVEPVLLSAQTRAEFPGRSGSLYRAAVIGTHGHVVVTTAILRAVRRRAERAAGDRLTSAGT
jgi:hypothetical protein